MVANRLKQLVTHSTLMSDRQYQSHNSLTILSAQMFSHTKKTFPISASEMDLLICVLFTFNEPDLLAPHRSVHLPILDGQHDDAEELVDTSMLLLPPLRHPRYYPLVNKSAPIY